MSRLVSKPLRTRAIDVALQAGVSQSAVSRTFGNGSVSANVRARVLAAARDLGYRPNAMAAAVTTRRSNLVAIIMTTNTNSHFPEVLPELSRAADRHGMRVLLFTLDDPAEVNGMIDQILAYQVDAVLSLTEFPQEAATVLDEAGVDLLLYNRARASYPANMVSCDHRAAGRALGDHLLGLGHRKFGAIRGWRNSVLAIDRLEGVFDALRLAGLNTSKVVTANGDFSYDSGRAGAAEILGNDPEVTCIVCINDMMAIGAIDEAEALGFEVPKDLSVAGFDGVPASRWERYQITTMRQPLTQLAAGAFDLIIQRLQDRELARESRLFGCTLIEGKSTTAVRQNADGRSLGSGGRSSSEVAGRRSST
jgi:DNA-binding LacI/PurR family transcriptional regulator